MEIVVQGEIGRDARAEEFTRLGVEWSRGDKTALGWSGGDAAAMLARALGAGLCAGGDTVLVHDGCCPAAAGWMGRYYQIPQSLFVEQGRGIVRLYRFGKGPERPGREADAAGVGCWESLRGTDTAYAADAARQGKGISCICVISVPGQGRWDQTLAQMLERMGVTVLRRSVPGVPAFTADPGGFRLTVRGGERGGVEVTGGEDALFAAARLVREAAGKFEVYFSKTV